MSDTQDQVILSVVAHKSSLGVRKILSPTGLEDSHNGHQMTRSPAHKEACILINILEPVSPSILDFSTTRSSDLDSFRLFSSSGIQYVKHNGGTRSLEAQEEASQILTWPELPLAALSAVHIPGTKNGQADFLS